MPPWVAHVRFSSEFDTLDELTEHLRNMKPVRGGVYVAEDLATQKLRHVILDIPEHPEKPKEKESTP